MGHLIVKLDGKYAVWSTVVDAPITSFMDRPAFEEWYRERYEPHQRNYGDEVFSLKLDAFNAEFEAMMKRVEEKGTSSRIHSSALEVVQGNRAGPGESCLGLDELVEDYAQEES